MSSEINTNKLPEAKITVGDNGYLINFSSYSGEYGRRGFMVAKDLDEVKKILAKELVSLK